MPPATTTLADPAFYPGPFNHALDQGITLLEIGRVLGRPDLVTAGGDRMSRWWLRIFWTCLRMAAAWRTVLDRNHWRIMQRRAG